MFELKQKFIELINKYMHPWQSGTGKVPVKLKSTELIGFAGEFFPITIAVENGDDTEFYSLTTTTVNEVMTDLGFQREVKHNEFDGLTTAWVVTLKPDSNYEFK